MALLDDMKDLQEALAVTNRIQNRHALMIEEHERWLEAMQASALETRRLIDQIAAFQLANAEGLKKLEASVQAFIDSLRRGGNGQG
jgi:hypothetical protein